VPLILLQGWRAAGRARLGLLPALILCVALAACGGQEAGNEPVTEPGVAPARGVSPRLAANFALLRTPADGLPPAVRRILRTPVPGMNWSLARRIPVRLPGAYWLAPGANDLCIVATTPDSPAIGTVCASVEEALRHSVANVSLDTRSRERLIVGVAPDGTRTVFVRSGVSTSSARVRDGNFVLRDSVSAPPDELTLR
jgi:hypothetical protein